MKKLIFLILLLTLLFSPASPVFAQTTAVQSTSTSLDVKIAPGELLPVSVKLSNFGGGKRVDVVITYLVISDKGIEIYKGNETVAVETTNNFVKNVPIPGSAAPGIYTAKTSITYQGQISPATTEFTFNIERKILGVYQDQFFIYGAIALFLGILLSVIVYNLLKRRDYSRFAPIDYAHIPKNDRVFYELISDTVMDMRHKVGDKAFEIASKVEGLKLDEEGRVIKVTKTPSKVIAELVSGYEKALGEKISFSFRGPR